MLICLRYYTVLFLVPMFDRVAVHRFPFFFRFIFCRCVPFDDSVSYMLSSWHYLLFYHSNTSERTKLSPRGWGVVVGGIRYCYSHLGCCRHTWRCTVRCFVPLEAPSFPPSRAGGSNYCNIQHYGNNVKSRTLLVLCTSYFQFRTGGVPLPVSYKLLRLKHPNRMFPYPQWTRYAHF